MSNQKQHKHAEKPGFTATNLSTQTALTYKAHCALLIRTNKQNEKVKNRNKQQK